MRVTDAELKVLAEAAENPPTIEPDVTEEHHDAGPIELMPTWKLIGALVADLEEARERVAVLEKTNTVMDHQFQAASEQADRFAECFNRCSAEKVELREQLEEARAERDEALGQIEQLRAGVEVAEIERDVIAGWLSEDLSEGQAARLMGVDRLEARAIRDTALQQAERRWKEHRSESIQ